MIIIFHKTFRKKYKKLRPSERRKCDGKLILFENDPFSPVLNNHSLRGQRQDCRSINIAGDLRAIFKLIGPGVVLFIDIDTHHNLYS